MEIGLAPGMASFFLYGVGKKSEGKRKDDKGNMIKGIASSYCEIFQRLAYQESADYLNARSKEIIAHEILSVIKKDGIDHFLALDILIKLMLIPCFMAEEDKK